MQEHCGGSTIWQSCSNGVATDAMAPMLTPRSRLLLSGTAALLVIAVLVLLPRWLREPVTYVAHADASSAALVGQLVDHDGKPLAGVQVQLFELASAVASVRGFRGSVTMPTGPDGTFRFDGLRSSEVRVAVADQASRLEGSSGDVELRLGHAATGLVVKAAPIPASRILRGRLRTPDGQPVAHRLVVVGETTWRGQWQVGVATDGEGRFELVAPRAEATGTLKVHGFDEPEVELGQVRFGAGEFELVLPARR